MFELKENIIVDKKGLLKLIDNGSLDRSTAISNNSQDCYLITKDIYGRVCLGAIGRRHLLKEKLNG
jgi:hypothetical protein